MKASGSQLSNSPSFLIVPYSEDGASLESKTVSVDDLTPAHVEYFSKRFQHLTDDLELPLEATLPGESELRFRICSVIDGAYVTYYFQDRVVLSALLLNGSDDEIETELMEIFRFLTIDEGDSEDPTEEEIESLLNNSTQFEFAEFTERPAVFEIPYHEQGEEKQFETALKMNRSLAAAFFAIERES